MPKATRANDSQETPKKRSRKTQPADGNGTAAVEPVTTAPAIAEVKSEVRAKPELEATKKVSGKSKLVAGNGHAAQAPTEAAVAEAKPEAAAKSVSSTHHNGHVSEELVRRRAYELYLQRRGQGGSPEQDWFQALQEISGQHVA